MVDRKIIVLGVLGALGLALAVRAVAEKSKKPAPPKCAELAVLLEKVSAEANTILPDPATEEQVKEFVEYVNKTYRGKLVATYKAEKHPELGTLKYIITICVDPSTGCRKSCQTIFRWSKEYKAKFIKLYVKVLDRKTNKPIEGARISLDGLKAITDESGVAVVEAEPERSYALTVEKKGYASITKYIVTGTTDMAVTVYLYPVTQPPEQPSPPPPQLPPGTPQECKQLAMLVYDIMRSIDSKLPGLVTKSTIETIVNNINEKYRGKLVASYTEDDVKYTIKLCVDSESTGCPEYCETIHRYKGDVPPDAGYRILFFNVKHAYLGIPIEGVTIKATPTSPLKQPVEAKTDEHGWAAVKIDLGAWRIDVYKQGYKRQAYYVPSVPASAPKVIKFYVKLLPI